MSYLGIPPFGRTARTITEVIATSGQSTFYPNGGYAVGYLDVSVNGAQLSSADYTAVDGISVVLNQACVVGDELRITSYTVAITGDNLASYNRFSYSATSNQTTFPATYSIGYIQVYLNGVLLNPNDYTATDTATVVLQSAVPTGTLIDILSFSSIKLGTVEWNNVLNKPDMLPAQTGNAGKYLKTDGTTATWQIAATVGAVNTNTSAITADYAIPTGTNAQSVGPLTQSANTTLTIAAGQRWQII